MDFYEYLERELLYSTALTQSDIEYIAECMEDGQSDFEVNEWIFVDENELENVVIERIKTKSGAVIQNSKANILEQFNIPLVAVKSDSEIELTNNQARGLFEALIAQGNIIEGIINFALEWSVCNTISFGDTEYIVFKQ